VDRVETVIPIYYQIKRAIKGWIVNKEIDPGEKIPSENELAAKFNVTRLTVRQAISQLNQEGFLNKRKGKGTFVTNNENLINSFSLEFFGLMDDLFSEQISKVKIKSVTMNRLVPSKLIKEKLKLNSEEKEVLQIKRARFLRDKPLTYNINYLPMEIGVKMNEKDLYERPLLQILEKDFGIEFTEAIQTIEASFADQEVAENLRIASGSPILFVERVMYTRNHKPVELFQSSNLGDQYKFIVRFKNVKESGKSQWIHQD